MAFIAAVNQAWMEIPVINDTSPEFSNSRSGVLSAQLNPGASVVNLVDAIQFPVTGGKLRVSPGEIEEEFEIIYTGKTGNQLTGVSGVVNTHPSGRTIQFRNITLNLAPGPLVAYRNDGGLVGKNNYKISFKFDSLYVYGNTIAPGVIVRHTSFGFVSARIIYINPTSPYLRFYSYLAATDVWAFLAQWHVPFNDAPVRGEFIAEVQGNSFGVVVSGTDYQGGPATSYSGAIVIPAGYETGYPGIFGQSGSPELLVDDYKVEELTP